MSIFGQFFTGYDPTEGLPPDPRCPKVNACATVVWYEKWAFTGYSTGLYSNTGISYDYGFTAFDMLGNVVVGACIGVKGGCGFQGNETCRGDQVCPDDDTWLARAREACNSGALPPPGSVQFVSGFGVTIGR